MQMFLNSYTFSWTIGICMYMQIKLITTANVLKQYIFIDRRFTPNPKQYLIDPLHLIQSGLHLLDDLHVSLLHVFSFPFLSLLITALHLDIKRGKISSFLQEKHIQSMKVFYMSVILFTWMAFSFSVAISCLCLAAKSFILAVHSAFRWSSSMVLLLNAF